ncbi:hypothetical protein [Rubrimonas cliftonensis]|uniref:Uncharacterized protein n=1 Tax=Rubrimonas cliftonensis TaxID=89524 RepID=A0A1H4FG36_9RHOB|nr:hypothetical protein [Rubrimonas cliftonensis]SEA96343.1 hypothetical protein SAMN05444370_12213 [Rubrimonas cliftonensis]
MTDVSFLDICGGFLRQHVLSALTRSLDDEPGDDAAREPLLACVRAWVADLAAGWDAVALEPARLAHVLETVWRLSIVRLLPSPDAEGRFVDVAVRADLTRALDLAVAAVRALDLLRDTDVIDRFSARRFALVEAMADAGDPRAEVRGTA